MYFTLLKVYILDHDSTMYQRRRKKKRKRKCLSSIEEILAYLKKSKKYNETYKYLKRLNSMIGMDELKQAVAEQLMFLFANNFETDAHFLNTVIQGQPGCGKTTVAKLLYEIWNSLDIFEDSKSEFKILSRSDFVGSYMGHTSNKSRKLLTKAAGGVIFIDEAYSLYQSEKDDYGKEAIDELNGFMSEQSGKTIIIIAGYKEALETNFFAVNSGLKRRFNWTFTIQKYNGKDLYKIFLKQLKDFGWDVNEECESLFEKYHDKFKNMGGDTANIAFKAKLMYSKRVWKSNCKKNKKILKKEIETVMEKYFEEEKKFNVNNHMYI